MRATPSISSSAEHAHASTAVTLLEQTYLGTHAAAHTTAHSTSSTRMSAIRFERVEPEAELLVLRAIVAREQALDELLAYCCVFEDDCSVELLDTILDVRARSLDVVDAVAGWRRRMVQTLPFQWRSVNYLLKMTGDLDFVSRSRVATAALDGVRLAKRNPFSTLGGLDQSMRAYWQHELPEAADLPVLLDATALAAAGVRMDVASKIQLAEHLLLLEERRFGRLSNVDAARIDHRLETLVKREAAFTAKRRFGSVKGHGSE